MSIFILLKEGASARKTQTPAAQPVPRPGKNIKLWLCFLFLLFVCFLMMTVKFFDMYNAVPELNF